MNMNPDALVLRRLGIDTYQELVAYLRSDSPICRSEGFEAQSRIQVCCGSRHIIATLNVVHESLIGKHQLGLSEAAWHALGGEDGTPVRVKHAPPLQSFSAVRGKIYGRPFNSDAVEAIVRQAERAVTEDKAEVICLGCGGMAGLDEQIRQRTGVPVVDGVTAAVTVAESLVRLGLSTSKVRTYATPRQKQVIGWPPRFGR